jgi:hypothetical protein
VRTPIPRRRQHGGLDPAGKQRVGRLLGPETQQAAPLGDVIGADDLLGREGRAAEGADLPGVHEVGERGESFLDVGRGVGAVDLVQVDPVGSQPPQALLGLRQDPAPRVAAAVAALAHLKVHLGGQHDLVAAALQRLAGDLLGLAARLAVHVGGVHEVDPLAEGGVDDPDAVVMVGVAVSAEHHGPQAVGAHLDAGAAEGAVVHGHATDARS